MPSSRYALVAYVHHPAGKFAESLRQELHPVTARMSAHLTILPPRPLIGPEAAALEFLEEACSRVVPFQVELGEVETFLPTTPTVFIQVAEGSSMRDLHRHLNREGLRCDEQWPYVPHLTILKTESDEQALKACDTARERWSKFPGSRVVHVEELMFVREIDGVWQDVGPVPLGRSLLSPRS